MSEKKDNEMTPEKAVAILAKHGTPVTIDEAGKVLEFMKMLVELDIKQIEKGVHKKTSADTNKKERLEWPFFFCID